ncbi:hydantoinase/oxoprolinase family protein [Salinicola sp.]|uniref:hydantoinase/oxoprolinase family protein n=1 Tax=Salinicola sp. TaxID=1978524 RepID=UPI00343021EF
MAALSVAHTVKEEEQKFISTDMGGTSFDVCSITSHDIPTTSTQPVPPDAPGSSRPRQMYQPARPTATITPRMLSWRKRSLRRIALARKRD